MRCLIVLVFLFNNVEPCLVLLAAAFFLSPFAGMDFAQAEEKNRVFEIRTYYANEGKLDALLAEGGIAKPAPPYQQGGGGGVCHQW